jgi:DNA-binding response OmpR family regulator
MSGTGALAGLRILVVDDDPDILAALSIALQAEGAVVDAASDGNEAMHRLGAWPPDAAVVDLMLPGQSGFAVVERCRAAARPVPAVIITANRGRRHAEYASTLGAAAYLEKPVPMARVVGAVLAAVGR